MSPSSPSSKWSLQKRHRNGEGRESETSEISDSSSEPSELEMMSLEGLPLMITHFFLETEVLLPPVSFVAGISNSSRETGGNDSIRLLMLFTLFECQIL